MKTPSHISVMKIIRTFILPGIAAFALALAPNAQAEVVCSPGTETITGMITGGAVFGSGQFKQLCDPIPTISNNAFDDDDVRAFEEVQDLTITENLILDTVVPPLSSNVIGAGSTISSHYVIFDPGSVKSVIGSVTFDEPIIGLIRTNNQFDNTDALLGNPTTSYPIVSQGLAGSEVATISGSTVDFSWSTNSPGDAIRVITGVNPVPGINVCAPGAETLTGTITDGSVLGDGQFKQICDPIGDVGDDNFNSFDLFAFEEQQAVLLAADLFLDDVNFIDAGETVSSFYVVFDPNLTESVEATITFPDSIIGVIGAKDQLQDSNFLGDASANYLNPNLLGLEGGDGFSFTGSDLTIDFSASTPGDSIRVILGSASPGFGVEPCDPQDITLTGDVTGGGAAVAGGQFTQLCAPIGEVGNDNYQSSDLFAFAEAQSAILAEPLEIDFPAPATIPAGTTVSSYYVAFDPGGNQDLVGSVTFPSEILGVMTVEASLTASDGLGNPTAVYLNPNLRGLEGGVDSVSVAGSTLSVDFSADSPGDYVRVIVATPQLPSAERIPRALLAGAVFVFGVWRLRRRGA